MTERASRLRQQRAVLQQGSKKQTMLLLLGGFCQLHLTWLAKAKPCPESGQRVNGFWLHDKWSQPRSLSVKGYV